MLHPGQKRPGCGLFGRTFCSGAGGFRVERITPVDQFRHSAHIEVVAVFHREPTKTKRRGRLLG